MRSTITPSSHCHAMAKRRYQTQNGHSLNRCCLESFCRVLRLHENVMMVWGARRRDGRPQAAARWKMTSNHRSHHQPITPFFRAAIDAGKTPVCLLLPLRLIHHRAAVCDYCKNKAFVSPMELKDHETLCHANPLATAGIAGNMGMPPAAVAA
jgi:hypothetical protein